MRHGVIRILLAVLIGTSLSPLFPAGGQERLKASSVKAKMTRKGPRYGLPVRKAPNYEFSERISFKERFWTSYDFNASVPNWITGDIDQFSAGDIESCLGRLIPNDRNRIAPGVWEALLGECERWNQERPEGGCGIVIGPLYYHIHGPNDVPDAFFVAICKKGKYALGWKSIGFIVPNAAGDRPSIYDYSCSVNVLEAKSGMDLFCNLPRSVQEQIEEMTSYELFCSYQEYEDPRDEREPVDTSGDYHEYYDID